MRSSCGCGGLRRAPGVPGAPKLLPQPRCPSRHVASLLNPGHATRPAVHFAPGFAAFAEALQGHEGDPRVRPLSEDLKQRMRSFNPAASQQGGAADEHGDADDAEDGDEDGDEEDDDQDDGDQDDVSEDDAEGAAEQ